MDVGRLMFCKLEQLSKQTFPILVKLFGKVILVKLKQLENRLLLSSFILSSRKVIFVILVLCEKQDPPRAVILPSMVIICLSLSSEKV